MVNRVDEPLPGTQVLVVGCLRSSYSRVRQKENEGLGARAAVRRAAGNRGRSASRDS
jgi:hypothetical protein